MSLYYELVRYEESLQLCKKILQLRPSDEKFILTKAMLEARLGQIDEAITTINNLLLDNNKLDVVWNLKGVLLFGMNQNEDALECFDEALKLNSENISALNNKGVILHYNGNFKDALKFFDHASNISSKEKIMQNIELTSKKLDGSEPLEGPPKDTGELDTEDEDNLEEEKEPEDEVTESAITEQSESIEEKEEEPEPEIEAPTPTDLVPNKETDKESATDIFSELGKISETVSEESLLETDSESEEEIIDGSEDTELNEEEDQEIEDHEEETELILPEHKELKDIKTEIEDTVEEPEIVEKEPEVELIDGRTEEQKKEKLKIESELGAQKEGKGKGKQEEDDLIPTKDQVIEKFIQISGVGASKAEALYEAGYTSYDSLKAGKTADVGIVKGIGKTLAKNIKDQLKKKKFKDK
jgi:tetratricopeptide (TPR) repeat protein